MKFLFAPVLLIFIVSCAHHNQIETKIIFGRNIGDTAFVSDSAWNAFVTSDIIPLFPDGFTILDADGYYRGENEFVHEPSKIFLLVHTGGAETEKNLSLLMEQYRKKFHQESVLRIDADADYSFSGTEEQ